MTWSNEVGHETTPESNLPVSYISLSRLTGPKHERQAWKGRCIISAVPNPTRLSLFTLCQDAGPRAEKNLNPLGIQRHRTTVTTRRDSMIVLAVTNRERNPPAANPESSDVPTILSQPRTRLRVTHWPTGHPYRLQTPNPPTLDPKHSLHRFSRQSHWPDPARPLNFRRGTVQKRDSTTQLERDRHVTRSPRSRADQTTGTHTDISQSATSGDERTVPTVEAAFEKPHPRSAGGSATYRGSARRRARNGYIDPSSTHGTFVKTDRYCTRRFPSIKPRVDSIGKRTTRKKPFFACIPTTAPQDVTSDESTRKPRRNAQRTAGSFLAMSTIDETGG